MTHSAITVGSLGRSIVVVASDSEPVQSIRTMSSEDYPAYSERPDFDQIFPFDGYRMYQEEAYKKASKALYTEGNGIKNVVLVLPTGVGKSGGNATLCEKAISAFYTTPLRSLQEQLEHDRDLRHLFEVLRGRDSYECMEYDEESVNCKECPINKGSSDSCKDMDDCTYWNAKTEAIDANTALVTFAYLVVDDELPVGGGVDGTDEDGDVPLSKRVSFDDREVIVVDEAQNLIQQTAELHAGFEASPYELPAEEVFGNADEHLSEDVDRFREVSDVVKAIEERAEQYLDRYGDVDTDDHEDGDAIENGIEQCEEFLRNLRRAKSDVMDGRPWVPEVDTILDRGQNERLRLTLKPIWVQRFLNEKFWSRADKRVISTATMPFHDHPETWLKMVGLDPDKTKVLQYPMPFPIENRKVYTDTAIGNFSSGGFDEHWDEIVERLGQLAKKHEGEKGLIHTVSYDRARRLYNEFEENAYLHEKRGRDTKFQIEEWQFSDSDMMFSPSMMEGVDLEGDDCRWQVLVKVPYPNVGGSRMNYLLDETDIGWGIFYEQASQSIQQSVGRGVRNMDDYCSYYVLDAAFDDVIGVDGSGRADAPEWFLEAVTNEPVELPKPQSQSI